MELAQNKERVCPICTDKHLGIVNDLLFCHGCEIYIGKPEHFERTYHSTLLQRSFYKKPLGKITLENNETSEDDLFWYGASAILVCAGIFVTFF